MAKDVIRRKTATAVQVPASPESEGEGRDGGGVQAVDRALLLIEALADSLLD
jgi:hypothetical protein